MSESRLAFLEAAVKKALSDPSFLAEGDKRQLYTDYVDAAGTRKNANEHRDDRHARAEKARAGYPRQSAVMVRGA